MRTRRRTRKAKRRMADLATLRTLRGFIFDMDGVVYRGSRAIPGAPEFLAGLRRRQIPFVFLTNNSTTPPEAVAQRLRGMAIEASAADILTSSEVTAAVLAEQAPKSRVFVIGEYGVSAALAARGLTLVEDYREADTVVLGMDRDLTYARLRDAALAIRRGAAFIATNADRTLPDEIGEIPGAGALVAALVAATDVRPRIIGKPEPVIFKYALGRLGVAPEATACVGDRPETDVTGGQRSGLHTIGLLSGVGTAETFAALQPPPDWVFADLAALGRAYFAD